MTQQPPWIARTVPLHRGRGTSCRKPGSSQRVPDEYPTRAEPGFCAPTREKVRAGTWVVTLDWRSFPLVLPWFPGSGSDEHLEVPISSEGC